MRERAEGARFGELDRASCREFSFERYLSREYSRRPGASNAYPSGASGRFSDMCIYCQEHDVPDAVELCPRCAFAFQVEVAEGLYRLGRYLASWAAFDEWLSGRRREAAPA